MSRALAHVLVFCDPEMLQSGVFTRKKISEGKALFTVIHIKSENM